MAVNKLGPKREATWCASRTWKLGILQTGGVNGVTCTQLEGDIGLSPLEQTDCFMPGGHMAPASHRACHLLLGLPQPREG